MLLCHPQCTEKHHDKATPSRAGQSRREWKLLGFGHGCPMHCTMLVLVALPLLHPES